MEKSERSCFDILTEFKNSVMSGNIPMQQKLVIEEQVNILFSMILGWCK